MTSERKWKSGDWAYIKFGSQLIKVYVFWATDTHLKWGKPRWLQSSAEVETLDGWKSRNPTYIGHGKRKWYTYLINNNLSTPFTEPDPFKPPQE